MCQARRGIKRICESKIFLFLGYNLVEKCPSFVESFPVEALNWRSETHSTMGISKLQATVGWQQFPCLDMWYMPFQNQCHASPIPPVIWRQMAEQWHLEFADHRSLNGSNYGVMYSIGFINIFGECFLKLVFFFCDFKQSSRSKHCILDHNLWISSWWVPFTEAKISWITLSNLLICSLQ